MAPSFIACDREQSFLMPPDGYNAQAAANEHQIVIAAEIEVVSPDFGHLERTVTAGPPGTHGGGRRGASECGRRGLRLLAHQADPTPDRRRHPDPDSARVRSANHAEARLEG